MESRPELVLAGRLIDGTGAPPRPDAALLLRDGRIEAVLERREVTRTRREGARLLDLEGATLLPGLIDPHVHLTFNAAANHEEVRRAVTEEPDARLALRALANGGAHLAGGVTTVRDTGGRGLVTLAVREAIREGLVPGPRVLACGPALTPARGHLHYLGGVANDAGEVRAAAAALLEAGVDFIKICASGGIMTAESHPTEPQYDEAALRAAVETAAARGRIVAAHVLASGALERCVRAGVRSIEHCVWQESPGSFRFRPDVAAAMRAQGIFAGLTYAGIGQARYREQVLGRPAGEDMGVWRARMEARYAAEREMIASGVRYVLHSDAGVRGTPFGEFWLVLAAACFELGITPLEAIRAVTGSAAELLGLEGEVGTLLPGRRADFLVVQGDPATEISVLARPAMVFQGGRLAAAAGELRVSR